MLIFRYLSRRFLGYFFSISILLAFLFNFIEFFEKLMRVKNADVLTILRFLGMRFLPSLFEMLPIGIWLATCLLLKELAGRHELELMELVTFSKKRFFSFFLVMSFLVTGVVMVIRERLIIPLGFKSEQFKEERLKQGATRKLVSKWFELDRKTFCYSSLIDLDSKMATDLLLFYVTPNFTLEKIVSAPAALLDEKTNQIHMSNGQQYLVDEYQHEAVVGQSITVPGFFSQLAMHFKPPTLSSLLRKIFLLKNSIPQRIYNDILYDFFNRIAFYLQLFLYPLVTFVLFCLTVDIRYRWVLVLVPYPLFTLLEVIASGLFRHGLHAWIALFPALLVSIAVLIGRLCSNI